MITLHLTSCKDHTAFGVDHLSHLHQTEWLRSQGYRPAKCGKCGRPAIWLDVHGNRVKAFTDEFRSRT